MRSSPTTGTADSTDRAAQRLAQLAVAIGGRAAPSASDHSGGSEIPPEWWSDHTRLAAPLPPVEQPPPVVVPISAPGRHAARRSARPVGLSVRDRLPAVGDLGSAHLAVIALAAALAIACTTWWLLRDRGPVEPMPTAGAAAPLVGFSPVARTSPGSGPSAAPSATGAKVTVDVVGKVRRPGIVVLSAGSRVVDAIKAAGGARRGVDLTSLNLARVLVDGEQVVVGVPGGRAGPPASGAMPLTGAAWPVVNLNTATVDQLETLPDVGPVTAQSILDWRAENGRFTSVDQLLDVDGIGDKTLAKLAPHVTV
ncbi:helix-hairpin-helix domain-containing protein [Nocardioides montaniterrae]